MTAMPDTKRLWIIVLLTIVGISAGYTVVLMRSPSAFSSSAFCPATCTGENCGTEDGCSHGKCDASCPGNCPMKHFPSA